VSFATLRLESAEACSHVTYGGWDFGVQEPEIRVHQHQQLLLDGDRDAFRKQLQALSKIAFPTRLLRIDSVLYSDDDVTVDDLEATVGDDRSERRRPAGGVLAALPLVPQG
jgi:hypothetical protein